MAFRQAPSVAVEARGNADLFQLVVLWWRPGPTQPYVLPAEQLPTAIDLRPQLVCLIVNLSMSGVSQD